MATLSVVPFFICNRIYHLPRKYADSTVRQQVYGQATRPTRSYYNLNIIPEVLGLEI